MEDVEDDDLDAMRDNVSAKKVRDVGLDPIQYDVSEKKVKDVALDPIQEDAESASKWPLEFKRKQSKIIELWHACDVSLVHRTYFFLLFKGDPADSFYMEVEIRRISLLKDTLSRGGGTVVQGQVLTSTSRYITFISASSHIYICIFCKHSKIKYFLCEQQEGFDSREADAGKANAEEAH
jgi:centromeric protein E